MDKVGGLEVGMLDEGCGMLGVFCWNGVDRCPSIFPAFVGQVLIVTGGKTLFNTSNFPIFVGQVLRTTRTMCQADTNAVSG